MTELPALFEPGETGAYVVGLVGPAGSGKDHLAGVLSRMPGHATRVVSPADHLRKWFNSAFPSLAHLSDQTSAQRSQPCAALSGRSWRDVVIDYSALVRSVHRTYLIDKTLGEISECVHGGDYSGRPSLFVITSVRLGFEAEAIEAIGGAVIPVVGRVPEEGWIVERNYDTRAIDRRYATRRLCRAYGQRYADEWNEQALLECVSNLRKDGKWTPVSFASTSLTASQALTNS